MVNAELSARLPQSWLPLGDVTALLQASMQQRSYHIQILPLVSTASASAAQHVLQYLPTPNATAYKLVMNVRANLLTPSTLHGCTSLPMSTGQRGHAWLTTAADSTDAFLCAPKT